jgi:hypothetical protein
LSAGRRRLKLVEAVEGGRKKAALPLLRGFNMWSRASSFQKVLSPKVADFLFRRWQTAALHPYMRSRLVDTPPPCGSRSGRSAPLLGSSPGVLPPPQPHAYVGDGDRRRRGWPHTPCVRNTEPRALLQQFVRVQPRLESCRRSVPAAAHRDNRDRPTSSGAPEGRHLHAAPKQFD